MNQVIMPALGQTSDEMRIVAWLKREGEPVAIGEPLINIETDKTTIEVESAFAGVLLKIVHGADAELQAGQVIAYIGQAGERVPDVVPSAPVKAAPAPTAPPIMPATTTPQTPAPQGKVLATPAARQLAREYGVDLSRITGTGPDGRIERDDVLDAIDRT